MASIISAGTTSGTALNMTGDTSGVLQLASNNGTTAVTVDTSQNVGIGVVPPTWNTGNALFINSRGSAIWNNGAGNTSLVAGAYYNSGWKYSNTSTPANRFDLGNGNGTTTWSYAAGGTIDSAVTFTEAMRIDSSGNVLINTTGAYANFTNYNRSAMLSTGGNTAYGSYSFTNQVSAVNNSTVTALRFLNPAGTIIGTGAISGVVYVYVSGGSGANAYNATYALISAGNGTTDTVLTLINSHVRGTNPVSSVQVANDGVTGGIAVTITYVNNSGVVNGGYSVVGFTGILY